MSLPPLLFNVVDYSEIHIQCRSKKGSKGNSTITHAQPFFGSWVIKFYIWFLQASQIWLYHAQTLHGNDGTHLVYRLLKSYKYWSLCWPMADKRLHQTNGKFFCSLTLGPFDAQAQGVWTCCKDLVTVHSLHQAPPCTISGQNQTTVASGRAFLCTIGLGMNSRCLMNSSSFLAIRTLKGIV